MGGTWEENKIQIAIEFENWMQKDVGNLRDPHFSEEKSFSKFSEAVPSPCPFHSSVWVRCSSPPTSHGGCVLTVKYKITWLLMLVFAHTSYP
jgi:hypothetical protein